MHAFVRHSVPVVTTLLLMATLVMATSSWAQTHVVNPAELQKQAAEATRARQDNAAKIYELLSMPQAQKELEAAHLNVQQVKTAVSTLSDQELQQLSTRADKAQADFAAGRVSDRDLMWILVAIAALILIIVAVR